MFASGHNSGAGTFNGAGDSNRFRAGNNNFKARFSNRNRPMSMFNIGLTILLVINMLCCLAVMFRILYCSWKASPASLDSQETSTGQVSKFSKRVRRIARYVSALYVKAMPTSGDVFPFILAIGILVQSSLLLRVLTTAMEGITTRDFQLCRNVSELVWIAIWIPAFITIVFLVETIIRMLSMPRLRPRSWVTTPLCLAIVILALMITWVPAHTLRSFKVPAFSCTFGTSVSLISYVRKFAIGGMGLLALALPTTFFVSLTVFLHLRNPSSPAEKESGQLSVLPPDPVEVQSAQLLALVSMLEVAQWIFLLPFFAIVSMDKKSARRSDLNTIAKIASIAVCASGFVLASAYFYMVFKSSLMTAVGEDRKAAKTPKEPKTSKTSSRWFGKGRIDAEEADRRMIQHITGSSKVKRPEVTYTGDHILQPPLPGRLAPAPKPAQQPIYARRAQRRPSPEPEPEYTDNLSTDILTMLGEPESSKGAKEGRRQAKSFHSVSDFPLPQSLPGLYDPSASLVQSPPPSAQSSMPPLPKSRYSRAIAASPASPLPPFHAPSVPSNRDSRRSVHSSRFSQYFPNPRESRDSRLFTHSRNSSIGSDFTMFSVHGGTLKTKTSEDSEQSTSNETTDNDAVRKHIHLLDAVVVSKNSHGEMRLSVMHEESVSSGNSSRAGSALFVEAEPGNHRKVETAPVADGKHRDWI